MRPPRDRRIFLSVRSVAEVMQLYAQLSRASWHPVEPSRSRTDDRCALHVSLLLPGIAHAFHAHVLNRSLTSIRTLREEAKRAFEVDPDLRCAIDEIVRGLTPADGLLMSQLRGPCQLPFWSRLAIAQFRKDGHSILDLSEAFSCSPRTVLNVLRKSDFTSSERRLTRSQINPPNKFGSTNSVPSQTR